MDLTKIQILGSGFTPTEYDLYRFSSLLNKNDAMHYLSNHLYNEIYRKKICNSHQGYILEDKWIAQIFMQSMSISVPTTYGLYHPVFGLTIDGEYLRDKKSLLKVLASSRTSRFIVKPRGGRKGNRILLCDIASSTDGCIIENFIVNDERIDIDEFVHDLNSENFSDFDGSYHGWLIQECIDQHPFLKEINNKSVNTFRVVTFLDERGECSIHFSILRVGVGKSVADNWDKGGLSIFVDPSSGVMGKGVFKPGYGLKEHISIHPISGFEFEGIKVPEWDKVIAICKKAAAAFSGVRAVGWDVALQSNGPVIIEGNADWGLPSVQAHTPYLTEERRNVFAEYDAVFPRRLKPVPIAMWALFLRRLRGSRFARYLPEV